MKSALLLTVASVWLAFPGPAQGGGLSIPAGYDLFETDPGTTISNVQLPAGFFGPGSDPFNGDVLFAGEQINDFLGMNTGDASTIVHRPESAEPAPTDTIPIEIVALSLISVEPITVTYNGGQNPEDWDVEVGLSPSEPSQGQMTIEQTSDKGGTFDSQIHVVPLFRFTSLSNGETRTYDGVALPPGGLNLTANDVPWRSGCVLPAFSYAGDDSFCPGLTPKGKLQLTVHKAAFFHHGVYPAQPALEHFKCYKLKKAAFKDRKETLEDQFGTRKANVTGRGELCNPAKKNDEPFLNKTSHLVCYVTKGVDPQKLVAVRNQFGSQRLLVGEARRLCVPTEKRESKESFKPIKVPIDHYQCYGVEPQTPLRRLGDLGAVALKDQFGSEQVEVGDPVQLCAPARKNDEKIQHPVNHLVCYAINGERVDVRVDVRNQFEKRQLSAIKSILLCVPTIKLVLSPT